MFEKEIMSTTNPAHLMKLNVKCLLPPAILAFTYGYKQTNTFYIAKSGSYEEGSIAYFIFLLQI